MRSILFIFFTLGLVFLERALGAGGFTRVHAADGTLTPMRVLPGSDGALVVLGTRSRKGPVYSSVEGFLVKLTPQGAIDKTFGTGGYFFFPHLPSGAKRLPDGRILVAGALDDPRPSESAFWVARLDPSGRLDESFGKKGEVVRDFGPGEEMPSGLFVARDGSIELAGLVTRGEFRRGARTQRLVSIRLLPDGKPDPRSPQRTVFEGRERREDSHCDTLLQRANGYLAFCHETKWLTENSVTSAGPFILALKADGTPDEAIAPSGKIPFPVCGDQARLHEAEALEDGGFLVLGDARQDLTDEKRGVVMRLTPEGRPDTRFGADGVARLPAAPRGVAIGPSGEAFVSGAAVDSERFILMRLTPNGAIDTRFGEQGVMKETLVRGTARGSLSALGRDPSTGKLLFAGIAPFLGSSSKAEEINPDWDVIVARFSSDGMLDLASFGEGEK